MLKVNINKLDYFLKCGCRSFSLSIDYQRRLISPSQPTSPSTGLSLLISPPPISPPLISTLAGLLTSWFLLTGSSLYRPLSLDSSLSTGRPLSLNKPLYQALLPLLHWTVFRWLWQTIKISCLHMSKSSETLEAEIVRNWYRRSCRR